MSTRDKKIIRTELGEKIRKTREKLHLTQLEVAEAAGMTMSYYAQIERGVVNPSLDKLQDIAKILNIKTIGIL
jgi:transcriptional regulator with XRE-family HTH domain